MIGRQDVRKKRRWKRAARVGFIAVFLFPALLNFVDQRAFSLAGLKIQSRMFSPAYAALDDLQEVNFHEFETVATQPIKWQRLEAGHKINFTWTKWDQVVPAAEQRVMTSGLTIKAPSQDLPDLQDANGDMIPLAERKERLIASLSAQEIATKTWQQEAQRLVRDAVKNVGADAAQRFMRDETTGKPIYVARNDQPLWEHIPENLVAPADSAPQAMSTNSTGARVIAMSGQLEVSGGLAFTGSDSIFTMKRLYQGKVQELGKILVTDARFEIQVKEARGQLVAELLSPRGQIFGRGILDLEGLGANNTAVNYSDLHIRLAPVTTGLAFKVLSAASSEKYKIEVPSASIQSILRDRPQAVNEEAEYTESEVEAHSTLEVEAKSESYWPTLSVKQSEVESELLLLPETMVKALIELTNGVGSFSQAQSSAVIWGKALQNGQPLANVSVELAGGYRPVYFNSAYIPDHHLEATSANGLFAIVQVRPGAQSLRAEHKGVAYPAQIIPARSRHVTYVEFALEDMHTLTPQVYDVFSPGTTLPAKLRLHGLEEPLYVAHATPIKIPGGRGNTYSIEADAGEAYELARMTLPAHINVVDIPMIRSDWLNAVATSKGINREPTTGIVVGAISSPLGFRVSLSGQSGTVNTEIVYFDMNGKILDSVIGPTVGGFVMFNVPMGFQTIKVESADQRISYVNAIVSEPDIVSLIHHAFSR